MSVRDHSMSRSDAISIADLPVVPLEQETKCPFASSRAIQSSMSLMSEVSIGAIGYGDTVPSHLPSRSHFCSVSKLSG